MCENETLTLNISLTPYDTGVDVNMKEKHQKGIVMFVDLKLRLY